VIEENTWGRVELKRCAGRLKPPHENLDALAAQTLSPTSTNFPVKNQMSFVPQTSSPMTWKLGCPSCSDLLMKI
jgi:hypothetical protein